MPSNDSRFYPRISATSSTTITCPQAVLDQFKPIKTPAVDEETPVVYYVEADGLTIHEAALAAGIPVAYFDESQGSKPCPQAVLDQFKPIKTPAVDEETPAVYYVEADGLTIREAALAAGIPVAYFDEFQGGKPRQVQTIEEATTVLYVLPPMLPTAMEPFFALARAQGSNPNHTLLFANYSYETWLQTGELPD